MRSPHSGFTRPSPPTAHHLTKPSPTSCVTVPVRPQPLFIVAEITWLPADRLDVEIVAVPSCELLALRVGLPIGLPLSKNDTVVAGIGKQCTTAVNVTV